jgi:hypothetical protein
MLNSLQSWSDMAFSCLRVAAPPVSLEPAAYKDPLLQ